MKVKLAHRHYGIHTLVREAEIPGDLADYATLKPDDIRTDEWAIDEDKLIAALPEGFLPPGTPVRLILLSVGDDDGGAGQSGLSRFRNWAKYFDAYCLTLCKQGTGQCGTAPGAAPALSTTDLGEGTCRAVMRDMPGRAVILEAIDWPGDALPGIRLERTPAAETAVADQWCVVLLPCSDMVSVRGNLAYMGFGFWDLAVLREAGELFPNNLFVRYPADPAGITGPEFGAGLRAVVERVLGIVEADCAAWKLGAR